MTAVGDQLETQTRRDVTFADGFAAALLADHLDELDHPDDSWELVKRNASRSVYRGMVGGQNVYLKHFHRRSWLGRLLGSSSRGRAYREFHTALLLRRNGVNAVPVLAIKRGQTQWLLSESVSPAVPADGWHLRQRTLGPAGAKAIKLASRALAQLVARMHHAGISHEDLHCGNVMVLDNRQGPPELVLMDLHRVWRSSHLSRRRRAMNLAQLLHDQYEFTTRTQRIRFLRRYLRSSGAEGSLRGWQLLIDACFRRHRSRQLAHKDRRITGRNKYFSPLSLPGGWRGQATLMVKHPPDDSLAGRSQFTPDDWHKALADIPSLLVGAQVVKDKKSRRVLSTRIKVGAIDLDVFITQPRLTNIWKRVLACLRPARTTRAFRLGHALLNRRMPTAIPLACVSRRVGPVLLDSLLISQAVAGDPLNRYIEKGVAERTKSPAQRHQPLLDVTWQLGRMLQRLHDDNFAHRNLSETNILMRTVNSASPQVVLLELAGLRRVGRMTMKTRFQGLSRLNISLLRCPSVNRAGRLRMLLGYLRRPGMGRIDFKPYWRVLEEWSAQNTRREIRSQRRKQRDMRRPGA